MKISPLYRAFRVCRYAMLVAASVAILSVASTKIAFAAVKTFTCDPIDVAVFTNKRIHVRCSPADGTIAWFALGVTDSGEANRMLSILSTAFTAKKKLTIWYDPADTSGASIGCQTNDCRLIIGVLMF